MKFIKETFLFILLLSSSHILYTQDTKNFQTFSTWHDRQGEADDECWEDLDGMIENFTDEIEANGGYVVNIGYESSDCEEKKNDDNILFKCHCEADVEYVEESYIDDDITTDLALFPSNLSISESFPRRSIFTLEKVLENPVYQNPVYHRIHEELSLNEYVQFIVENTLRDKNSRNQCPAGKKPNPQVIDLSGMIIAQEKTLDAYEFESGIAGQKEAREYKFINCSDVERYKTIKWQNEIKKGISSDIISKRKTESTSKISLNIGLKNKIGRGGFKASKDVTITYSTVHERSKYSDVKTLNAEETNWTFLPNTKTKITTSNFTQLKKYHFEGVLIISGKIKIREWRRANNRLHLSFDDPCGGYEYNSKERVVFIRDILKESDRKIPFKGILYSYEVKKGEQKVVEIPTAEDDCKW